MTIVTEARKCPFCQRALRSNNTRGVCTRCWKKGYRPGSQVDEATPVAEKKPARKKTQVAESVTEKVERFLGLTSLLGIDGEGLLGEFIDGWVGQVREKANSLVEEA